MILFSRPKYGCLDYGRLLAEMKEHNFFTEIAFIPWNYGRSDPKTVRLLTDNADRYAICVHGYDHTSNEFGKGDYRELSALSSGALWRMEQHRKLTGLPYDPVMVFPQGRFSATAMQALKDSGYSAAFNSTLRALDGDDLPVSEYCRPATAAYHDFPLFLRRYPEDRSGFVQDLSCGRPIIVVEHHGAFRGGYEAITGLVDWINGLGNIKWNSLARIAERYSGKMAVPRRPTVNPPQPLFHRGKVASRRFLSEARDNHVETSGLLTRAYKMLRG